MASIVIYHATLKISFLLIYSSQAYLAYGIPQNNVKRTTLLQRVRNQSFCSLFLLWNLIPCFYVKSLHLYIQKKTSHYGWVIMPMNLFDENYFCNFVMHRLFDEHYFCTILIHIFAALWCTILIHILPYRLLIKLGVDL